MLLEHELKNTYEEAIRKSEEFPVSLTTATFVNCPFIT
jgi:hypothetical protein